MQVVEPLRAVEPVEHEGGRPERAGQTFEAVYQAERPFVVRLGYLMVGSAAVAEELAQEAFTALLGHLDQVDNHRAWLRTAVVRLALRWQDRQRMEGQRLGLVGPAPPVVQPERDELWDALGRLRPERRAVLVLRFYEDLDHAEIGTLVGCSAGTVRSRVRRALADLRKELER